MVPIWRIDRRSCVGAGRLPLVHHHHRHTCWPAMLQICKPRLFPVWERSCVWRRRLFLPRQPDLDHFLWSGDGNRILHSGLSLVHHDPWHSNRKAMLQNGQAVFNALRGIGRVKQYCMRPLPHGLFPIREKSNDSNENTLNRLRRIRHGRDHQYEYRYRDSAWR